MIILTNGTNGRGGFTTPGPNRILKSPDELDRELVECLLPELRGSPDPRDHVKMATACQRVSRWRAEFLAEMRDAVKAIGLSGDKRDEILKEAKLAMERHDLQLQELKRELRSAQELTGMNESKKVAAVQGQLTAKEQENRKLRGELETKQQALAQAEAEIAARKTQVDAYERDMGALAKAAANQAEATRQDNQATAQQIDAARACLVDACEIIDDRYGNKPGPFVEALRERIDAAIEKLPVNPHAP